MGIFLTTNSGVDRLVDHVTLQPLVDNTDEVGLADKRYRYIHISVCIALIAAAAVLMIPA
jgi:hypothetical protein